MLTKRIIHRSSRCLVIKRPKSEALNQEGMRMEVVAGESGRDISIRQIGLRGIRRAG